MITLINGRSAEIIPYIFKTEGVLASFAKHIYSKSVTDILILIFKNQELLLIPEGEELAPEKKKEVVSILINNVTETTGNDSDLWEQRLNCASFFLELSSVKSHYDVFTDEEAFILPLVQIV